MARGHKSHPDTDNRGDTVEFAALPTPETAHEHRDFELSSNQRVSAWAEFQYPIELRLSRGEQTPSCYIIRYPYHRGPRCDYAVVQPEVACAGLGEGWVEFSPLSPHSAKLGRAASPLFQFGPDVSREHCVVSLTNDEEGNKIEIENYGRNGLYVAMRPVDLARGVEAFEPYGAFDN